MHPDVDRLNAAPRCGATTRSGHSCNAPAVRGKRRCRMHGGAAGSGAPTGNQNAVTHGMRTQEMARLRTLARLLGLTPML